MSDRQEALSQAMRKIRAIIEEWESAWEGEVESLYLERVSCSSIAEGVESSKLITVQAVAVEKVSG